METMEEVIQVIGAVVVLALLYVVVPVVLETYAQFRSRRAVACPRDEQPAEIELDATRAAASAAVGNPVLQVTDCTRWPERAGCGQECLRPS